MTDDLVKQLRTNFVVNRHPIFKQAADRIEELQKQLVASNKQIEDLEEQIFDMEYEMFERGERS